MDRLLRGILLLLISSVIIMLIWNHLLVGMFFVQEISFWDALELKILCNVLFGTTPFLLTDIKEMKDDLRKLVKKY